ncbi:MAG TPA: ADP-glyceromanno-heptose 6-epimerase [Ignavibacteriaceae bacterium]|nr:ADP-glyceromanno-heptose 6-epimerase [Ignavibacteriaceae bacterium]
MIIVTGGAGFIGSAVIWQLNNLGKTDILIVDELGMTDKWKNLVPLKFYDFMNKLIFIENLNKMGFKIEAIIHMGANSSTTERNADHLLVNNYEYSRKLAEFCIQRDIRFIYASSAATYGDGSKGFEDREDVSYSLRPLNMYGYSKNLFDIKAYREGWFNKIAGIKYFNVYGPNEYHKGNMRSVVHKAFEQIRDTGKVRLFKSMNPKYNDGEQMRDFVYVKDAVNMTLFFLENKRVSGIFNAGSGKARTWNDLVNALFKALNRKPVIEYVELPAEIADRYQYFTEANIDRIKNAGYSEEVTSLENGVTDYVKNYLLKDLYLGY